jgi:hypothetical protein
VGEGEEFAPLSLFLIDDGLPFCYKILGDEKHKEKKWKR